MNFQQHIYIEEALKKDQGFKNIVYLLIQATNEKKQKKNNKRKINV